MPIPETAESLWETVARAAEHGYLASSEQEINALRGDKDELSAPQGDYPLNDEPHSIDSQGHQERGEKP